MGPYLNSPERLWKQAHRFSIHSPAAFSLAITKSRRFMFLPIYTKYSDVWEASIGQCVSPRFLFCMFLRSVHGIHQTKIHNVRKHDYIHSETTTTSIFDSISASIIWVSFNQGILTDLVVGWNEDEFKKHVFNSYHGTFRLDRNSTNLGALSNFVFTCKKDVFFKK